jgi:hypothetical protein
VLKRRKTMVRRGKCVVLFVVLTIVFTAIGSLSAWSAGAAGGQKRLIVADFEDGQLASRFGTKWYKITDQPLGGRSTVEASIIPGGAGGTRKAGRMTGTVTTDFQVGGFAGMGVEIAPGAGKDLSAYTGISFYAKGDAGRYRVSVPIVVVKDHNEYGKEFDAPTTWRLLRIPFSQLAQNPHWGRKVPWTGKDVTGVEFVTVGAPRSRYVLDVDQIGFY